MRGLHENRGYKTKAYVVVARILSLSEKYGKEVTPTLVKNMCKNQRVFIKLLLSCLMHPILVLTTQLSVLSHLKEYGKIT